MRRPAALAIEDLNVWAREGPGWIRLVENFTLAVRHGEVMGVVGETGAGKTLSMKAFLGLLPLGTRATGRAALEGGEWIDLERAQGMRQFLGRKSGVVLQNPAGMFDPVIRLKHQLVEGVTRNNMLSHRDAADRAESLLHAMGIDEPGRVLDLYPYQLSGGMGQRAAIAMALMPRPRVLVVDEPTSALDAHLRFEVLRLLRGAAADDGTALLLVSHDLGLVGHFCDSVTVMYAGHAVETGPSRTVLSDPQHPYTAALLTSSPTLEAIPKSRLPTIEGAHPRPGAWPQGCVFEPRCPIALARCRSQQPVSRRSDTRSASCYLAFRSRP